ncbi:hypothetical protein MJO28_002550 [Puccinia striiformis f. sp. tritici]|uniref:Uncharacterized protein n=1 Tax=Puccinia striiformis f. sp. tritici TaxID=168172 RepID=A0ACC0EQM2_9BASI|nr:hypothetical protein MJO28_002550 [Puccinia striiformis f. sp. tritici]
MGPTSVQLSLEWNQKRIKEVWTTEEQSSHDASIFPQLSHPTSTSTFQDEDIPRHSPSAIVQLEVKDWTYIHINLAASHWRLDSQPAQVVDTAKYPS